MLGQMHRRVAAAAVLAFSLASCAGERRPATEATTAILRGDAGVAQDAGIQVAVSVGAWEAQPPHLETELTPVLVRILNQGQRPLRVTYDVFQFSDPIRRLLCRTAALQHPGGGCPAGSWRAAPLSLCRLRCRAVSPGILPAARRLRRLVCLQRPLLHCLRAGLERPQRIAERRTCSNGRCRRASSSRAAEFGGFLYFQRLKGGGPYTFKAYPVDALTGERFGVIAIPFVAE